MTKKHAELTERLEPYKNLERDVTAEQLRVDFAAFGATAVDARIPHTGVRTTRGSRITYYTPKPRTSRLNYSPPRPSESYLPSFELTGRKIGPKTLRYFPMEITSVRELDPKKAKFDNHGGSWYSPMPRNIQFANGAEYCCAHHNEDVWAIFQGSPAGNQNGEIVTARVIEPGSPQAVILGGLAVHLLGAVKLDEARQKAS